MFTNKTWRKMNVHMKRLYNKYMYNLKTVR